MVLKNFVVTKAPEIPEQLKGKLTMVANHPLTDSDVKVFGYALQAIALMLQLDNIPTESLTTVNVVFTKDGSFSMIEESPTTGGLHICLAIYPLERLNTRCGERFKLVAFIEELVHHYWRIEDETVVKYKVVQVAQLVDPSITIEELKGWDINGL